MAYFSARDGTPASYCEELVRKSQIFIGIIGFRYGSIVPDTVDSISYVELEFSTATTAGIPRLIFLLDDDAPFPPRLVDRDRDRVEAFRQQLRDSNVILQTFANADALEAGILHALNEVRVTQSALPISDTGGTDRRPWMSPVVPGQLVRRPALAQSVLTRVLADDSSAVAITASLEGAGGFGKTTLAAMICQDHEVKRRFPGGLLWATIGEQRKGADLAAVIGSMFEILSGEQMISSDPIVAGARLGELLDTRPPILLVVDDVWSYEQLQPFLIGGAQCRRLITTRNRNVVPRGNLPILVDAMTADQATNLIIAGIDGLPDGSVEELVHLTGRWPVLLGLVNRALVEYIKDGAEPADAAQWSITELTTSGPTALDLDDPESRAHAVAATVDASLRLLTTTERERYLDLAIFSEDTYIPRDVLVLLWAETGGLTAIEAERLRAKIVRLSLAFGRWEAGAPAIHLHDVVRTYLRHCTSQERRATANAALLDAARKVIRRTPNPETDTFPWWELPASAEYFWRHLSYHLKESGQIDELAQLVCDLKWVEAKTAHFGSPVPAEADLATVQNGLANTLRRSLKSNAALLNPMTPSTGLGATLASRLSSVDGLEQAVLSYSRQLPNPKIENIWPLPDRLEFDPSIRQEWHAGGIYACDFSSKDRLLASAGEDGSVRLWDLAAHREVAARDGYTGGVRTCVFSPDGELLAFAGGDGLVRLWNITENTSPTFLQAHRGGVWSCAFSPNGRYLASAGSDGLVRIWDFSLEESREPLSGHAGGVYQCVFSPDSRFLASGGADRNVRIWNSETGDLVAALGDHATAVWGCAFSPNGERLASACGDGSVNLWNTSAWQLTGSLTGHNGVVNDCTFGPGGELLATAGDDKSIRLWRVDSQELVAVLQGHEGFVRQCTFSSDGQSVASASADKTVRIWDVATQTSQIIMTGSAKIATAARSCAFSPDGKTIASTDDAGIVSIWDVQSGRRLRMLDWASGSAQGCGFSPRGLLAVGYSSGALRVWNPVTAEIVADLEGHAGGTWNATFSSDGRFLLSCGTDQKVRVRATDTWATDASLEGHAGGTWACTFSSDGTRLASGGADGSLRIWDTLTHRRLFTLEKHTDWVSSCAFSPDGHILASASADGTLQIWDADTGEAIDTLEGHTDWVRSCAFSPDGLFLASAGSDWMLRIWDIQSRKCSAVLRVAQPLHSCTWHPTARSVAAAGGGGVYLFSYRHDKDNLE
nr:MULTISPECIES: NB-ARC domain-containing protein [unclassified Frankia]